MSDPTTSVTFDPAELLSRYDPDGKLSSYFDLLKTENQKVNLVSRETINSGLNILAAESLLPLGLIERKSFESYLDIGSGGGFPAIPIILAGQVKTAFLVERTSKKTLALGRILKGLDLADDMVQTHRGSFEECDFNMKFDLITLRLVALTKKILRKVKSVLSDDGYFVYYSSPPEEISTPDWLPVTYCYEVDNPTRQKAFTIFKKNK